MSWQVEVLNNDLPRGVPPNAHPVTHGSRLPGLKTGLPGPRIIHLKLPAPPVTWTPPLWSAGQRLVWDGTGWKHFGGWCVSGRTGQRRIVSRLSDTTAQSLLCPVGIEEDPEDFCGRKLKQQLQQIITYDTQIWFLAENKYLTDYKAFKAARSKPFLYSSSVRTTWEDQVQLLTTRPGSVKC